MTDAVTAKIAEWEALYRKGVTIRPDPMPALLGFVREVRARHVREPYADEPSEGFCRNCQHCGAAGTWPCPTEQAAQKWIGGEGS